MKARVVRVWPGLGEPKARRGASGLATVGSRRGPMLGKEEAERLGPGDRRGCRSWAPTRTWTLGWSQDHRVSSRPCLLHPEPLRDLSPEARVERTSDDAYRRSILGAEGGLGEKLEGADGEQTVQPCSKQSDRAQRLSGERNHSREPHQATLGLPTESWRLLG